METHAEAQYLPQTASSPNQEALDSIVEIELAVERGEVSFSMVMKALYLQWARWKTTPDLRERYRNIYRTALLQFMAAHGGVSESFYADDFGAGVVLTGNDQLFSNIWWDEFKFDTTRARSLEADINDLRVKAGLYLSDDHRRICLQRLLRLYKGLISSLRVEYQCWVGIEPEQGGRAPHAQHIADLEQLHRELGSVLETYHRVGLARGQARYIIAAVAGTLATAAVAATAVAILGARDHTWIGALAFAGGAIGALLSVLERLTREALSVQFEAERLFIFMGGVSRPVVGALSGLALFVLVEGRIVPLTVDGGTTARDLFFAGIAFLAGFGERFAIDVFGKAASSLPKASSRGGSPTGEGMARPQAQPARNEPQEPGTAR